MKIARLKLTKGSLDIMRAREDINIKPERVIQYVMGSKKSWMYPV